MILRCGPNFSASYTLIRYRVYISRKCLPLYSKSKGGYAPADLSSLKHYYIGMKRASAAAAVISLSVIVILLLLQFIGPISLGPITLKRVAILSDLFPPKEAADTVAVAQVEPVREQYNEYRPEGVTLIEDFSRNAPGGMNHFYETLAALDTLGRPLRIAYYSDSFIEGDILTADLRQLLQEQYGGNGVGWLDCEAGTNAYRKTVRFSSAGFTGHVVTDKGFDASRQGISQRWFQAAPGARIHITGTDFRPNAAQWQRTYLYFRTGSQVRCSATVGNNPLPAASFTASPRVQAYSAIGQTDNIHINVEQAGPGTEFFGVSVESPTGIIVDNFAVRGIPGFSLRSLPQQTLADFAALRPYDLIVLHYGLNAFSSKAGAKSYRAYADRMKEAVDTLRKAYPSASIMVVSISDRAQRTAAGIETLPNLESFVSYQRLYASECGVAFWNLFEAMGGRNTIPHWVEKGYAAKDYTHLSQEGGRVLAGQLVQALNAGAVNYSRKKQAGYIP